MSKKNYSKSLIPRPIISSETRDKKFGSNVKTSGAKFIGSNIRSTRFIYCRCIIALVLATFTRANIFS